MPATRYVLVDADNQRLAGPKTSADLLAEAAAAAPAGAAIKAVADPGPGVYRWDPATSTLVSLAVVAPSTADGGTLAAGPRLTVLEFRSRWTWDEKRALKAAERTNDDVAILADELRAAAYVDPADPRLPWLLNIAVAAGVLAPARVAELLAPVGTYPDEPGYQAPTS